MFSPLFPARGMPPAFRRHATAGAIDMLILRGREGASRAGAAADRPRAFSSRAEAMRSAFRSIDLMFRLGKTEADAIRLPRAGADSPTVRIDRMKADLGLLSDRLMRDFEVSGRLFSVGDQGEVRSGEFELKHPRHGKLLSIDAEGKMTFYDRNGEPMDPVQALNLLFGLGMGGGRRMDLRI